MERKKGVKMAFSSLSTQGSVQELRKRITVLDCQLRKSEVARKTFEASTEKLLHFVEVNFPITLLYAHF